jgi:hypothetical protein
MKKFFAVASLALASFSGFAQNEVGSLFVTPKIGLSAANMSTFEKSDYRVGLAAGAELGYQVLPDFSVSIAAMYSQQGTKAHTEWSDGTIKLDYLNLPMMANYYWDHGITLKVGLEPGINLSAKGTVKIANNSNEVNLNHAPMDTQENRINVKSVVVALPVGISYEKNNCVFDLRYNIGLTEALAFNTKRSTNYVFQLTFGYKLPIK